MGHPLLNYNQYTMRECSPVRDFEEVIAMARSFFGGIHPKENKHYAENAPIQDYREPDILVIPM